MSEGQYDIFISYARADRDWALRLNKSLTAPGRKKNTFFDYHSLRAGDDWEVKIEMGLKDSRHLIAIWSSHAKDSDWVSREISTFYALAEPKKNPGNRLIFLNLQGANQAYKSMQQISLPALQAAYADRQQVDLAIWDNVMSEIDMGLDPNMRPLPIPVVVLTLSLDDLKRLPANRLQWIHDDYRISRSRLELQYGRTRADWRPLGGLDHIQTLLEHIRIDIDKAIQGRHVEWQEPEVDFWTDMTAVKRFISKDFLCAELSLLVIDPVAIYDPDIYQRLVCFQDSFTNARAVIATLPPFGVPRRITGLKNALQERATPYFDDYFQPVIPPKRRLLAQCVWNTADVDDIRRHLLVAAGALVTETNQSPISAFVRHGAG